MKTAVSMARSLQDSSSKRHFHWTTNKVGNEDDDHHHDDHVGVGVLPSIIKSSSISSSSKTAGHHHHEEDKKKKEHHHDDDHHKPQHGHVAAHQLHRRKLQAAAVSRLRSVLTSFSKNRLSLPHGLGPRVVGTLFGSRRGHVHFALQRDPTSHPAFLIELASPISGLVREMASGLVRIALECDKSHKVEEKEAKKKDKAAAQPLRLLEEPVWRTFCNGKKYGFASRRECGPKEWKVLKAVEPISMGAGVLPPAGGDEAEDDGELMYMRAKFERIVGSRDSEAFYMMNPDSNGAPELSIYLLRV